MASPAGHDALLLFRQSVATQRPLIPTTSSVPSPGAKEVPLSQATHLQFNLHTTPVCITLDTPTRFVDVNDQPFDLGSVYFAYSNHQRTIAECNDLVTKLNDEFAAKGTSQRIQGFSFVERLELVTWLEGADECERIKPLEGAPAAAAAAAAAAADASAVSSSQPVGAAGASRAGKGTMDPRLAAVYDAERKMGDRNSVLRGIKPTDFSHVRKLASQFLKKPSSSTNPKSAPGTSKTSLPLNQRPSSSSSSRRPDPIILLSPSASSLLRLSNIKSFLEKGRFISPDSPAVASSTGLNLLHLNRVVRDVDPHRSMRFVLVEGCEQFKPDYWNRVVAVFTTGQAWQFKSYKWSKPNELFRHVLGVYVGYRGEEVPETVKSWGHRVVTANVERWSGVPGVGGGGMNGGAGDGANGGGGENYKDKEAAEQVWRMIEGNMRVKGWRRDACPTSI